MLMDKMREYKKDGKWMGDVGNEGEMGECQKVKIMVCAPSNAAIDLVVSKVI